MRDKIVQQAIRKIIEPRFERLFLPNSFADRPGKGALRTIKYIVKQCGNKDYQFSLRLDVDNYFDEIDHVILQQRLTAIGIENELIRLIMLSVKMGRVKLSKERKSSSPMWPNGSNTSLTISDMKRKHFYVVTYDVSDDKRRGKVVKLLEGIGTRMNFSVFECMLTDIQYRNMCSQLSKIVVKREDWVNIYPLCTECYARIAYIPDIKKKEPVKIAVV